MKKHAAIVVLAALASLGVAGKKKPTPKPTEAPAKAGTSTAMPSLRNLRITQIYDNRKIFTATDAEGKAYRFTYPKTEDLKVGSVVDVTYTGSLEGPEPATVSNLNLSKSN